MTGSGGERRMKNRQLEEFIGILNEELDLLSHLHSILTEQQDALIEGSAEKIKEKVESQISAVTQIAELEERRKSILREIVPADDTHDNLDTVLGIASGDQAERLSQTAVYLREALESLGLVNRRNGMLIRQSMSYIDKTIKLVAGADSAGETYTPEGAIQSTTRQIALDSEI
jgi:flagellar biosynthesis/type III secretory pathway chaperone